MCLHRISLSTGTMNRPGEGGDTQLLYSIRLYCYGAVGMIREWLMKDNITPAQTVVQMMFRSMPDALHRLFF